MTKKGRLFVVAGPSGIGKGTICKTLLSELPELEVSISWTTREVRLGEVPNQTYFYHSEQEFEDMAQNGGFLEHASIYGTRYGTPKDYVQSRLEKGKDVILEIETQGAMQVMKNYPEAVSIYLLPPTMLTLRKRLFERGREDLDKATARFLSAYGEIELAKHYSYVIINDKLDDTIEKMHNIFNGTYKNPEGVLAHIEQLIKEEI